MADEQVDIVDKNNQVIGTTCKSIAHRDGHLHRIVIAELVNQKGKYCFVKQAGDRQDPGQFVSPIGGHVTAGENIENALIRECQEEVGFTPKTYKCIGSTIYNRHVIGRHENHLFLVYEIQAKESPVLNHESVEFQWFSPRKIKETLKSDPRTFGAAWHHVFKNLYPNLYN